MEVIKQKSVHDLQKSGGAKFLELQRVIEIFTPKVGRLQLAQTYRVCAYAMNVRNIVRPEILNNFPHHAWVHHIGQFLHFPTWRSVNLDIPDPLRQMAPRSIGVKIYTASGNINDAGHIPFVTIVTAIPPFPVVI